MRSVIPLADVGADGADVHPLGSAAQQHVIQFAVPKSLADTVAFRVDLLTAYQNAEYAQQYAQAVAALEQREMAIEGNDSRKQLSKAVARNLFKVMAYKDEYEVARLHADPAFKAQIAAQFDGDYKLAFHLAPPLLARKKPGSDTPAKMTLGSWMMPTFGVLARFKGLRGTPLDVFGYTHERRRERALRDQYLAFVRNLATSLTAENKDTALKLAQLPDQVRGYGHVKLAALDKFDARWSELLAQLRASSTGGVELRRMNKTAA